MKTIVVFSASSGHRPAIKPTPPICLSTIHPPFQRFNLKKSYFRQNLQDYSGLIFILSHFPDGSEKTQSAFSGIEWFLKQLS
jgi:hypothetical protein